MPRQSELGTHCPATKAADILGDTWTLQIVRAMLMGATRYSDLQQAVPRISPTVLSARLKKMADQGIIVRRETPGGRSASYRLTPSGRELRPLMKFLARWGLKWAERNIRGEKVDIGALMWDLHKSLRTRELPDGETVLSFSLGGVDKYAKWWIVAAGRTVDLWPDNPGKDVDLYLATSIETLIEIWQGRTRVRDAVSSGELAVDGSADLVHSIDNWFPVSPVAGMLDEQA